jgi:phosphatidylglycerol:prolipoprotein diacylglycerol transferase
MIPTSFIYWDPNPEVFTLPFLNWPVLWYGLLFAFGFAIGFLIFVSVLTRFLGDDNRKQAVQIADQFTVYMVVGTVIGARVGHFLFYEHPSNYLYRIVDIFKVWEGGLASHGALVGIIFAVWLYSKKVSNIQLTAIRLLDFVSIPTAFAGACIRVGNFINQEILGTATDLPWGVVFGHPADGSALIARHPVQIYESLFYLCVFFILWKMSFKQKYLHSQGKILGLFLVLVFGFRFLIEFLKLEQSQLVSYTLNMGQILSLPVILAGILLLFWQNKTKT